MAIALSVKKLNRTRINLFLDIGLVAAYVVERERDFTGLRNHELIGLALGVALLLHIVLHWHWIVGISKTFIHKLLHESRANYLLALLLLVNMLLTVATGILISETLGLSFNIREIGGLPLRSIHTLSADLSLVLVALHVAMHWKWIGTNASKYLFNFHLPLRKAPVAVPSSRSAASEMQVSS